MNRREFLQLNSFMAAAPRVVIEANQASERWWEH